MKTNVLRIVYKRTYTQACKTKIWQYSRLMERIWYIAHREPSDIIPRFCTRRHNIYNSNTAADPAWGFLGSVQPTRLYTSQASYGHPGATSTLSTSLFLCRFSERLSLYYSRSIDLQALTRCGLSDRCKMFFSPSLYKHLIIQLPVVLQFRALVSTQVQLLLRTVVYHSKELCMRGDDCCSHSSQLATTKMDHGNSFRNPEPKRMDTSYVSPAFSYTSFVFIW